MMFVIFPCGDMELVKVLKHEDGQVCVQMPFGPFWTDADRLWMCP
jgi:hypothetical protein